MLEEAVFVIRELFTGRLVSHEGKHYTVDTARLYSVPDTPPRIYMSAFGEKAAKLAARIADGYVLVQPSADLVRLYRESGGGRPAGAGWPQGVLGTGRDAGQEDHAPAVAHRLCPW